MPTVDEFRERSLEVDTDVYVYIHHNAGGEVSCSLPQGAQTLLADEIQLLQFGSLPKHAQPFKGIGSGIVEICPAL